jgi:hypothetical protein
MPYLPLIELGIGFLEKFLAGLKWGKAPAEVIASVQAAYDALATHRMDIISKSNLDSLRG